ncbi:MAG: anhydro-N-acetylmuramic acid kinase [Alphaproteobacteria bacterium]|nr:anhydro-N-acetylmuramic acid kinase [Alphaproteobacteria bacterium]MBU0802039.1 anhydro-N-acetylmuramic acid kinase [Alphaproteobacteria bacterium]MBU0872354.1 anhydro-N-acetylmuramic acid kinase [Alphaproteobacteria bacterium]MBU1399538.1 anhydro-N-acetylmuramic acid kinase [Alphaproteobacteria bacterium]MBU1589924.1 anhydro-N-acetylmuramic acid kinase [Alphaproteobacteria bacterium]
MTILRAVGLMSGTSMDGIDLAMLRTDGLDFIETGVSAFIPYEAAFRRTLEKSLETAKAIVERGDRPDGLAALENEITLRHARAVAEFLAGPAGASGAPDVIGFHGQTVLHRPAKGVTVQLGDGALLAEQTGVPVVFDMRANDMACGGQGAPLVPAYHAALARSLPAPFGGSYPVVYVNVGGISNITCVPAEGDPVAFDTGPGNTLIDQWVSREGGVPFDAGGAIASEGGVNAQVVLRYLDNPFFAKAGPKSLDRNDFTLELAEGMELSDGARTLAAVSAEAILKSVAHLPERPKLWVVCGGGRKNPHIVGDLRAGAAESGAEVIVAEDAGLNGDATEAEAWAYLAVRSIKGLPLTFPGTTGCRQPATGGVLARPTLGAR